MAAAFRILLAEDNPGDVRLFREALSSRDLTVDLTVAQDGQKAIELVKNASACSAPLDLIVLDVNLPRYQGDEVLRSVRAQPLLRNVPVIMLTSSSAPGDRAAATWLGADLFIRKPSDLEELLEVARIIEEILTRPSNVTSA